MTFTTTFAYSFKILMSTTVNSFVPHSKILLGKSTSALFFTLKNVPDLEPILIKKNYS